MSCEYDARHTSFNILDTVLSFRFAHMVLVDNKFDSSINGGDSDKTQIIVTTSGTLIFFQLRFNNNNFNFPNVSDA